MYVKFSNPKQGYKLGCLGMIREMGKTCCND